MCELQFKRLYRLRKGKVRCQDGEGFKPKIVKVHNTHADMFYSMWTDEIYFNELFPHEEYERKYPFHAQMMEDGIEAILTHEAIHQVLCHTAGWTAASYFDKICPSWAMKYWMNPPGVD